MRGISKPLALAFMLYAIAACSSTSAAIGNVALGKFYTLSVQPDSPYTDHWPVVVNGSTLTNGTKLTDGLYGTQWPLDDWPGWSGKSVQIRVDLGRPIAICDIRINAASRTDWGICFPTVAVETSLDGVNFTSYAPPQHVGKDTSTWSTRQLIFANGQVSARWVKFNVTSGSGWTFLDEIEVNGNIEHSSKYVPSSGCYLGAFPVESHGYLDIPSFESLIAPKAIRMVLWYADWQQSFQDSAGYIIDGVLKGRFLELGWLPYNTTSAQIAAGSHDSFLYNWFTACAARNYPLWIRPMNEMNGPWTWPNNGSSSCEYGGDPQTYRWAWRRIFNIAEQAGCTGERQIFVWSPDTYESSNVNTQMEQYYPGDAYVDWVGVSSYDWVGGFSDVLQKAYDQYSVNKPMMISEGGCAESAADPTWKSLWIQDWFTSLKSNFPRVKAAVWFNSGSSSGVNYRIDSSAASLDAFKTYCLDPYFIGADTSSPSGSVSINSGSEYTNTASVILTVPAVDADGGTGIFYMRFCNAGSIWSPWEKYKESRTWELTPGSGNRTVYAQFADAVGNLSAVCSDDITMAAPMALGDARVAIGSAVYISNVEVMSAPSDPPGLWIADGHIPGFKVIANWTLRRGDRIDLAGVVSKVDGVPVLLNPELELRAAGPVSPAIGLNNTSLANDLDENLNYSGINSVGLLVTSWGKVTDLDTANHVFYIDDGSNLSDGTSINNHPAQGLRIYSGSSVMPPALGSYVRVTGIRTVEKIRLASNTTVNKGPRLAGEDIYVPLLAIRDQSDIKVLH